jgi:hypothetical protein
VHTAEEINFSKTRHPNDHFHWYNVQAAAIPMYALAADHQVATHRPVKAPVQHALLWTYVQPL